MPNRNRHMSYRQSVYRRKRIKVIIIIAIVSVILAFAMFLTIGNILHASSDKPSSDIISPSGTQPNTPQKQIVSVEAYPLKLLDSLSQFSYRVNALPEEAEEVCIALNNPNGTLLFRPELASRITDLDIANGAAHLQNSLSIIQNRDLYVTAILYLPPLGGFSDGQDIVDDLSLSTWTAVACEALRGSLNGLNHEGVDDLLLVADAATPEDVNRLTYMADKIHSACEDAVVGLALSQSILQGESNASLVDNLSKSFDYLALDTRGGEEEEVTDRISAKITPEIQRLIMYYKMRVLLPTAPDSAQTALYVAKVKEFGISNWQMIP